MFHPILDQVVNSGGGGDVCGAAFGRAAHGLLETLYIGGEVCEKVRGQTAPRKLGGEWLASVAKARAALSHS